MVRARRSTNRIVPERGSRPRAYAKDQAHGAQSEAIGYEPGGDLARPPRGVLLGNLGLGCGCGRGREFLARWVAVAAWVAPLGDTLDVQPANRWAV